MGGGGGGGGGGRSSFGRPTGGGGGGANGGPRAGDDLCSDIDEFTDLLSPKEAVLKKVKRGQELRISQDKKTGAILVLTADGDLVGSVAPLVLELLIKCMAKGKVFVAEVISLAGGQCKLRIRPKGA